MDSICLVGEKDVKRYNASILSLNRTFTKSRPSLALTMNYHKLTINLIRRIQQYLIDIERLLGIPQRTELKDWKLVTLSGFQEPKKFRLITSLKKVKLNTEVSQAKYTMSQNFTLMKKYTNELKSLVRDTLDYENSTMFYYADDVDKYSSAFSEWAQGATPADVQELIEIGNDARTEDRDETDSDSRDSSSLPGTATTTDTFEVPDPSDPTTVHQTGWEVSVDENGNVNINTYDSTGVNVTRGDTINVDVGTKEGQALQDAYDNYQVTTYDATSKAENWGNIVDAADTGKGTYFDPTTGQTVEVSTTTNPTTGTSTTTMEGYTWTDPTTGEQFTGTLGTRYDSDGNPIDTIFVDENGNAHVTNTTTKDALEEADDKAHGQYYEAAEAKHDAADALSQAAEDYQSSLEGQDTEEDDDVY